MKKIPNVIYLQVEGTMYDNKDEHTSDEVTWCADRINDTDVVYYRHKNTKDMRCIGCNVALKEPETLCDKCESSL